MHKFVGLEVNRLKSVCWPRKKSARKSVHSPCATKCCWFAGLLHMFGVIILKSVPISVMFLCIITPNVSHFAVGLANLLRTGCAPAADLLCLLFAREKPVLCAKKQLRTKTYVLFFLLFCIMFKKIAGVFILSAILPAK